MGVLSPFGAEYALRPKWNRIESWYVRLFGLVDLPNRLRARLILRALRQWEPRSVLDFGSGTGCYAFYLSRLPEVHVSGVDVDAGRVAESTFIAGQLARQNIKFLRDSGSSLRRNMRPSSLDTVLAIEVLQYLPNMMEVLREIRRLLKPGGRLLGHVPAIGHLRPFETVLFDDRSIKEALMSAGFQVVELTPTFGRLPCALCSVFDVINRSRLLGGLLFPLLLLISVLCRVESKQGNYRFFIARKNGTP